MQPEPDQAEVSALYHEKTEAEMLPEFININHELVNSQTIIPEQEAFVCLRYSERLRENEMF